MKCPTCGQEAEWERMSFGLRLRCIRERMGLSQRDAAAKCNLPQTTYSLHEARAEWPQQRAVEKLAAGLGLRVSDLLGFTEPEASE